VPSRRQEDHIRDLCAKVIAAPETELEPALSELKSALREHTIRLRQMAAAALIKGKPSNDRCAVGANVERNRNRPIAD